MAMRLEGKPHNNSQLSGLKMINEYSVKWICVCDVVFPIQFTCSMMHDFICYPDLIHSEFKELFPMK